MTAPGRPGAAFHPALAATTPSRFSPGKMIDIFQFRDNVIDEFKNFSKSFTKIRAEDIKDAVRYEYDDQSRYWPAPLMQINPEYQSDHTVGDLAASGKLHPLCERIFSFPDKETGGRKPLRLYTHQEQAIDAAASGNSYIVTTGTGSGKSLSFFIPIIDRILKEKKPGEPGRIRAIIIYPMNALANSQLEEVDKYLSNCPEAGIRVGRYTGQESQQIREGLRSNPPDILLTNYMMLELLLMREQDRGLIKHCRGLEFLVLDELHTYRGRQGADVALLVRRLRSQLDAKQLICIGTSATMSNAQDVKEQHEAVSRVASEIFGTEVLPENIISETLHPVASPALNAKRIGEGLGAAVEAAAEGTLELHDFKTFSECPLAGWLEQRISITPGRPARATPMRVDAICDELAQATGLDKPLVKKALFNFFLSLANADFKTPSGKSPFAFKLHQFVSGPGKLYCTLKEPGRRYITLDGQRFSPENPEAPLFSACFCSACGQEFFPVWIRRAGNFPTGFSPRDIGESGEESDAFGYLTPKGPAVEYPEGDRFQGNPEELPDEWLDFRKDSEHPKVSSAFRKCVPVQVTVNEKGMIDTEGASFWFTAGKFRFCPHCGTSFPARGSDKSRLWGLSGEGRSSATTVLTLTMLREMIRQGIPVSQQKLLGFTDNRQDAALQSGHFNDFIDQMILRSSLVQALKDADGKPIGHKVLADRILKILNFDQPHLDEYAREYLKDPKGTSGKNLEDALAVLRASICYRLFADLRDRGLYNRPSLEALGLMKIDYDGLAAFAREGEHFTQSPELSALTAPEREALFRQLLDYLRKALCISSSYLKAAKQREWDELDKNFLTERWSFGKVTLLEHGSALSFEPKSPKNRLAIRLVSAGESSGLVRMIRRSPVWKTSAIGREAQAWKSKKVAEIVHAMVDALHKAGIFVREASSRRALYQINDQRILWRYAGDNEQPEAAGNAAQPRFRNRYFRSLYLGVTELLRGKPSPVFSFESHEHTAQVPAVERMELEQRFRFGKKDQDDWSDAHGKGSLKRLPVLYCSPTMELGIDISALNLVYMRNVPPTPANYVQRAGRAGRSGQPAMAITYCTSLSPHDQWYFSHPEEMVQGIVKEPALDISNRSLIENHLHSVWLSCVREQIPDAVPALCELAEPGLPLKAEFQAALRAPAVTEAAVALGRQVVAQAETRIKDAPWYGKDFVEQVIASSADDFDRALDHWRGLLEATRGQMLQAQRIMNTPGIDAAEARAADRRQREALEQKNRLENSCITSQNNDFYTYRYLASRGFLPGYNFPAMPLLAWIPEKAEDGGRDGGTILSRARFLGLSEFGPRNLVYHCGKTYRIVRVKLRASQASASSATRLATQSVYICPACGYSHPAESGSFNVCENCGAQLTPESLVTGLYQIDMVETEEAERITCEEESRRRQGFEMQTVYRFAKDKDGRLDRQVFRAGPAGAPVAEITYAPSARIWKINAGWRNRANKKERGFAIDAVTGYWSKKQPGAEDDAANDAGKDGKELEKNWQTIVPFVSDTRNVLLLKPYPGRDERLSEGTMATLQAALKRAIEQTFQIESSEIDVQPLPSEESRRMLMIYETGEGGAGVLARLATESRSLARVAEAALELMHYRKGPNGWNPDRMDDTNRNCIAGCYRCLLSYYNQPDHERIDRRDIGAYRFLVALTSGQYEPVALQKKEPASAASGTPAEEFLKVLKLSGLKAPDDAPYAFKRLGITVGARYKGDRTVIVFEPLSEEDKETLEDEAGWTVLDFSDRKAWSELLAQHEKLFRI